MLISDWSSDVCSSDLPRPLRILLDMLHKDRHQFRPPAAGVIGDPQQRRVAQAKLVAAAGLEQMRETHARSRAIKTGDVALDHDRTPLARAPPKAPPHRHLFPL